MATVRSFTAERMLEIENTTVVDGEIQCDDLILLTREGTPINAGNVRGPQGVQGPPYNIQELWPAGSIRASVSNVADPGWLLFGQSIVNAQTLYPALWAVAPVSWKTGANLTLPSDIDNGLRGSSAAGLGAVSGANTKNIATANLPPHGHTIDHDHGNISTANSTTLHNHGVAITSGDDSPDHWHWGYNGAQPFLYADSGFTSGSAAIPGGLGLFQHNGTGYASNRHKHSVNGNTGNQNVHHAHNVDLPNFSGVSGNAGSGTALNVQDAAINVRFQIKAH